MQTCSGYTACIWLGRRYNKTIFPKGHMGTILYLSIHECNKDVLTINEQYIKQSNVLFNQV
jgi:hypothetical protein